VFVGEKSKSVRLLYGSAITLNQKRALKTDIPPKLILMLKDLGLSHEHRQMKTRRSYGKLRKLTPAFHRFWSAHHARIFHLVAEARLHYSFAMTTPVSLVSPGLAADLVSSFAELLTRQASIPGDTYFIPAGGF